MNESDSSETEPTWARPKLIETDILLMFQLAISVLKISWGGGKE